MPGAVLKPHCGADITSGVNATRCLSTSRNIAASCPLVGIVACALVLACSGTGAAESAQARVVKHPATLAVLQGGVLTLVREGGSTGIGPVRARGTVKPMTVTDFHWSADGRYLGWEQSDPSSGRGAIGWYDTASHRRSSWQFQVQYAEGLSVSSSGLALLVAGENLNSPSTLITYKVGGQVRRRSVIVPTSDNVVGYTGGFIMGPDIRSGTQLWRVSSSGAVTRLQALPRPATNGPPYEVTAVSPDGRVFAAELGDHTDGCGVGRASRIFVIDETRGTVSRAVLPAGPRWRVESFVFDPIDTLDATMVDCTQKTTMRTAVLWVSPRGALTGEKNGALVATASDRRPCVPGGTHRARRDRGPHTGRSRLRASHRERETVRSQDHRRRRVVGPVRAGWITGRAANSHDGRKSETPCGNQRRLTLRTKRPLTSSSG